MPAIWRLAVVGIDHETVRPHQLHGAMCSLFDEQADHRDTRKDWAVGPVLGDGSTAFFDVRTLSDERSHQLLTNAPVGTPIRFGTQQGLLVTAPTLQASATYADLTQPTSTSHWDLAFLSPTAPSAGRRSTPLIQPSSLIGSLIRRWESLTDAWLPRLTPTEQAHVYVTWLKGRTIIERLPHAPGSRADKIVPGFVGDMTLRADDQMVAAAVDCLLRFAEYAGVGVAANYGLGAVRVTPAPPGRLSHNKE